MKNIYEVDFEVSSANENSFEIVTHTMYAYSEEELMEEVYSMINRKERYVDFITFREIERIVAK